MGAAREGRRKGGRQEVRSNAREGTLTQNTRPASACLADFRTMPLGVQREVWQRGNTASLSLSAYYAVPVHTRIQAACSVPPGNMSL